MLDVGMGPQDLLLYEKRIFIWFGYELQWVNWFGNPRYPVNSTEFLATFYFLQLLAVNADCLSCILHMYVGYIVCNMHVYVGSSASGCVHAPKNGFLKRDPQQ